MVLENYVFIFIYPNVFSGAAVVGGCWAVRGPELGRRGGGGGDRKNKIVFVNNCLICLLRHFSELAKRRHCIFVCRRGERIVALINCCCALCASISIYHQCA